MNPTRNQPDHRLATSRILHCAPLLALLLVLPAREPGRTRLDLKVSYSGPETVDAQHPISVLLFDGPDMGGGNKMVAAGHLSKNGGQLSFSELPETVYIAAIFDPLGNFTGLSGIIPGSAVGVYAADGGPQPTPVSVGKRTKVELEFDDSGKIPGDPDVVVPPTVRNAADGILEIRTYTVHPGMREDFIDFFVNKTLKGQKKAGLRVTGQFRSLENENQFVWVRSYASQEERTKQLREFYLGADWIAVQDEAGKYIADTSVMLVEPTKLSKIQ